MAATKQTEHYLIREYADPGAPAIKDDNGNDRIFTTKSEASQVAKELGGSHTVVTIDDSWQEKSEV